MRDSFNSYRNTLVKKKDNEGQNRQKTDQMQATKLKNLYNKNYDNNKGVIQPILTFTSEYQFYQLRQALSEAVEENEILRERVIQLEAYLAGAQQKIEDY